MVSTEESVWRPDSRTSGQEAVWREEDQAPLLPRAQGSLCSSISWGALFEESSLPTHFPPPSHQPRLSSSRDYLASAAYFPLSGKLDQDSFTGLLNDNLKAAIGQGTVATTVGDPEGCALLFSRLNV